ncbi:MAG: hypothetical protein Sapg2KO_31010 [Saprospiraceae bacterium]
MLSYAQGHTWWANNVAWDGSSHWSTYIISAPRFLGPNALPIPIQNNGVLLQESQLELAGNAHFTAGDQTYNPKLSLDYVLVPEKVAFRLSWVPIEYFKTRHELKTERRIFHTFYDQKTATGDVYLHTNIQVLNENQHFANARLRIGYRFASSNYQGAARFTDAPGYYFDLGTSKDIKTDKIHWRPSLMLGFFVWQTNRADQFQNDAFLYGLGLEMMNEKYTLGINYRGYLGYLDNGDKPAVLDLRVSHNLGRFELFAGGGIGFADNLYDRLELGSAYQFK